ncbi:hypothetical protein JMJ35_007412 [Cladonia borealis]|uniref:Berberine/berberine-like domain-containing protein n=1 Tax=Cladonia borealis TaxID=184061 RepID=A0AA39QVP2_9LECA|nr:hypothetical protein JMJ35_007412 [Cladonia borealis]
MTDGLALVALFVLAGCAKGQTTAAGNKTCKCFLGEACWPSDQEWSNFNATVGGRLIKTVPLGSPCHYPDYDATLCEVLQSEWLFPPVYINSFPSVQDPICANASCDPFTPQKTSCMLGNYVRYTVNVTGPDDIAATIQFADENNIRLVIRNTAHDYLGRSTGAVGLAIWTHYLQGVEVKDWSDADYTGKAVKLVAGAQGLWALDASCAVGLVVVTGECPTVGIAGGYTHSPLSTAFGLSADNTLEFGSSDGRWGVRHRKPILARTRRPLLGTQWHAASFTIARSYLDYSAIANAWHAALPDILDSGTMATYYAEKDLIDIFSITGYNRTQADLEDALVPFIESMAAMNVSRFADPTRRAVPFSRMLATQDNITDVVMPIIEQVTPNAGAYINEADFQPKDWQDVFFGSNDVKLLAIKGRYDPKGLFYNQLAVGSERWKILEDGRMCEA